MLSRVSSLGLRGIDGYEVSVECYITNGLRALTWWGCRTPR